MELQHDEYNFWDSEYGKIYHHLEGSTPYKRLVNDILSVALLEENLDVLDAGAGSGYLLEQLVRRYHPKSVIALDISPSLLKRSETRFKKNLPEFFKRIEFEQHDLSTRMRFDDGVFDAVISNLVLPYITSFQGRHGADALEGVLNEMFRVLKPGGIFCWSTPVINVNFLKVFFASWKDIIDPRHPSRLYYGPRILSHALRIQSKGKKGTYHFYTQENLERMLGSAGFRNITFRKSFAAQALIVRCEK